MSRQRPLRGACSCGRIKYVIVVPEDATENATIFFDHSSQHRRSQASPLTAWLHVPLKWYQSYTTSFFPDETHSSIRRTFTPQDAPQSKRNFCGFCGTHISYWSEETPAEAEYVNITVGSLLGEDIRALDDLGLLPQETEPDSSLDVSEPNKFGDVIRTERHGNDGDVLWFEEMIEGSRLGRHQKTKRGVGSSSDGRMRVEWEISDYRESDEGVEPGTGRAKRKIGDTNIAEGGDVNMET